MKRFLRRMRAGLADHPGVEAAAFFSLVYSLVGVRDGGLRWLWYGLVSLVWWAPVLVTAWQSGREAERAAPSETDP